MKSKINFYKLNCLFIILILTLNFQSVLSNSPQNKAKWVSPKSADQIVNPLKGNDTATKEGKKTFQQLCVICHGDSGKGDGLASVSLNPRPANLALPEIQNQTDGAIYWKITEGRSPMATYKDALTETQRWQLVNFIRTFKKK
ncbi:MAG: cytochrome c [Prolixibacteraceae bacterium]